MTNKHDPLSWTEDDHPPAEDESLEGFDPEEEDLIGEPDPCENKEVNNEMS